MYDLNTINTQSRGHFLQHEASKLMTFFMKLFRAYRSHWTIQAPSLPSFAHKQVFPKLPLGTNSHGWPSKWTIWTIRRGLCFLIWYCIKHRVLCILLTPNQGVKFVQFLLNHSLFICSYLMYDVTTTNIQSGGHILQHEASKLTFYMQLSRHRDHIEQCESSL